MFIVIRPRADMYIFIGPHLEEKKKKNLQSHSERVLGLVSIHSGVT